MGFFYVWETVDFPIQLTSEDGNIGILQDCKDVIISFEQGSCLIEKNKASEDVALDYENDIINVHLTQEDTGKFKPNKDAKVQVNILYEDTERDVSVQANIQVLYNSHKGVME